MYADQVDPVGVHVVEIADEPPFTASLKNALPARISRTILTAEAYARRFDLKFLRRTERRRRLNAMRSPRLKSSVTRVGLRPQPDPAEPLIDESSISIACSVQRAGDLVAFVTTRSVCQFVLLAASLPS
jgi:hypothetical protein